MSTLYERIIANTVKTLSGCRKWQGLRTQDGYGQVYLASAGKNVLVHRLVYELVKGPIGSRLFVCHTCDRPCCCEESHLWLGTNLENVRDAQAKGRIKVSAGPITTRAVGRHHYLNAEAVRAIRAMRAAGKTQAYCALQFGVTQATISQIDRGLIWGQVK